MESWQRRGHDRKPNIVVRFIYGIADWLGDFGPIVNNARRGTGYLLAIGINMIIMLAILFSSLVHSVELLERAGFKHGTQYLMLLPFEVMFLLSSNAIDKSFARGKYFPFWPLLTFSISLVFIWRSNLIGLSNNIDGQVIAWVIPVLLIGSKGLLFWQFKNKKESPSIKEEKTIVPVQIDYNKSAYDDMAAVKEIFIEKSDEIEEEITTKNIEDETVMSPEVPSNVEDEILEKKERKTTGKKEEKTDKSINKNATKKRMTQRRKTRKKPDKMVEKALSFIEETFIETGGYPPHSEIEMRFKLTNHYAKKARAIFKAKQEEKQENERLISKAS